MGKTARNHGIDLLRILSMLGVVFLHTLGHGGILGIAQSPDKFAVVWFLEILAYPAVNCFVLISGFVGYRGEKISPRLKSLLVLMFTVFFYNFGFYALFTLLRPETFTVKELFLNLFPTYGNKYWFFTTYFALFLLSPFLNLLVHKTDFRRAFLLLLTVGLFSILSVHRDNFYLMEGYSVLWFVLMYLTGAILKKHSLHTVLSKKLCLLAVAIAFLITWLSKVLLHVSAVPALQAHSGDLVNYVSPTIVVMAVGLLILFSNATVSERASGILSFLASSAFSVYLIHDNFYVRMYLISNLHKFTVNLSPVLLAVYVVCCAAAIFLFCILADKVRIGIFRLLKIDPLAQRIEDFCKSGFRKLCSLAEQAAEKTEG